MSYVKNPCKDCPDKGCGAFHDICEKHIAFKEALERVRQIRNGILRLEAPSILLEKNIRKKLNREKKRK